MNFDIKILGKQTPHSARPALSLYQRYIAPFVYGPLPPYDDDTIINNGTISFIEGKETFGITCAHCIDGFNKRCKTEPNIFLRFGDLIVTDLDSRIIDKNDNLALCTIRLDQELLNRIGGERNFLFLSKQPDLQTGTSLCIIGFPGQIVKPIRKNKLEAGIFCLFELIRDGNLSNSSFIIELKKDEWKIGVNQSGIDLNTFQDFGGLSGCPIFFQNELSPVLVGVIFESYPLKENGKLYLSARARYNCVDENGRIIE